MTTVGILGAGLSGVLMGMQLTRAGIDDFTIYEKQPDVGGTWLRNTYPGLHCDVPSHLYCYSFEPNDWSMVYSPQAEIQAYIRRCAEKYGVLERIRFETTVDSARYDDAHGEWNLQIAGGETATHRLLVSATGGLTAPNLPRIDGLDVFEGEMFHSGAWRHDIDLTGKRVAVVGSAASAVQVVPEVAARAEQVFVFSRTPNWVMPRGNRRYSEEEKQRLRSDAEWRRYRRQRLRGSMYLYRAFKKHRAAIDGLRWVGVQHMKKAIDDPAMIAALTPDYDPGCKRIVVSDEYYPALAEDHVELIPQGVIALTADSVVAVDGSERPVDVVVFCTGYKLGSRDDGRAPLDVWGIGGRHLSRALAERPEAYRGIAIPGFPNYFTVCGINGVIAYAPLFMSAEVETEKIAGWVRRLIDDDLRAIEVRADITRQYNEDIQAELSEMSWASGCTNFYTDSNGRVLSFHPGTIGRFRREMKRAGDDDFLVTRN